MRCQRCGVRDAAFYTTCQSCANALIWERIPVTRWEEAAPNEAPSASADSEEPLGRH